MARDSAGLQTAHHLQLAGHPLSDAAHQREADAGMLQQIALQVAVKEELGGELLQVPERNEGRAEGRPLPLQLQPWHPRHAAWISRVRGELQPARDGVSPLSATQLSLQEEPSGSPNALNRSV